MMLRSRGFQRPACKDQQALLLQRRRRPSSFHHTSSNGVLSLSCAPFLCSLGGHMRDTQILAKIETRRGLLNFQVLSLTEFKTNTPPAAAFFNTRLTQRFRAQTACRC